MPEDAEMLCVRLAFTVMNSISHRELLTQRSKDALDVRLRVRHGYGFLLMSATEGEAKKDARKVVGASDSGCQRRRVNEAR